MTVGVNGLAELAPHIDSGAVRALAISSDVRVPGVGVPTFIEQGVAIEIENWRSVVAPPGINAAERQRLEAVVEAMVTSAPWRAALERYRWNDRYLAGTAFARYSTAEEARVQNILSRLGTGNPAAASASDLGRYPVFVLGGLAITAILSMRGIARERRAAARRPVGPEWAALGLVGAAAVVDLLLLERLGFILASSVLFWLTARAFDRTHPARDAVVAGALAVAAWVLFVRLLQLSLPPGLLAGWI
ncbi:MAG: tripartite tricarboxylate transporter substrate-binding protein [Vicinamibacterales bacterium]